jgi:signal recognition particle subunit SRP54
MGDVVALVEKASEAIEAEEAERMARRMAKGQFDMNDFLTQIRQLQKMGGLGGLMGMLPGIGKMQKQIAAAGIDDSMIKRQEAIILSMTKKRAGVSRFAECVAPQADRRRLRHQRSGCQ